MGATATRGSFHEVRKSSEEGAFGFLPHARSQTSSCSWAWISSGSRTPAFPSVPVRACMRLIATCQPGSRTAAAIMRSFLFESAERQSSARPPCISHTSSGRRGRTRPVPSSNRVPPGILRRSPVSLGPQAGPRVLWTRCLLPARTSTKWPTGFGSHLSPVVMRFGSLVKR